MRKEIKALIILAASLLSGCAIPHYYYSPNIQNAPLFRARNEFTGLAAFSSGVANSSFELLGGYSITRNVALTAGLMSGRRDDSNEYRTDYSKNRYYEGGIGYYKYFRNNLALEIYTGYGTGSQEHVFARSEYTGGLIWEWFPDGNADIKFSKFFIQPDIGFKGDNIEAAFSLRATNLNYKEVNFYNTTDHLEELNLLKQNLRPWLLEPALIFRGGGKSVKCQVQIVFSKNLSDPDLWFEPARFTIGLYFNLGGGITQNNSY